MGGDGGLRVHACWRARRALAPLGGAAAQEGSAEFVPHPLAGLTATRRPPCVVRRGWRSGRRAGVHLQPPKPNQASHQLIMSATSPSSSCDSRRHDLRAAQVAPLEQAGAAQFIKLRGGCQQFKVRRTPGAKDRCFVHAGSSSLGLIGGLLQQVRSHGLTHTH
jgi:hypothetical protein